MMKSGPRFERYVGDTNKDTQFTVPASFLEKSSRIGEEGGL